MCHPVSLTEAEQEQNYRIKIKHALKVLNVDFSANVNNIQQMEAYSSLLISSGPIRNRKITYFHCNIDLRNER
jgi:hypothetical protein